jgi:alkylation response protein AidB-like acyl-CoA dehydrogenase
MDMCRNFALNEMLPHMRQWDEEEIFPRDTLKQLASLGFGAMYAREVRPTSHTHTLAHTHMHTHALCCAHPSRPSARTTAVQASPGWMPPWSLRPWPEDV